MLKFESNIITPKIFTFLTNSAKASFHRHEFNQFDSNNLTLNLEKSVKKRETQSASFFYYFTSKGDFPVGI